MWGKKRKISGLKPQLLENGYNPEDRMRKIVTYFAVLTLCAAVSIEDTFAAHAMEAAVTEAGKASIITVKGSLGVLNGEAHEIVYGGQAAPGNEDYKVSELIWDLKSLVMAGAIVSIGGDGPLVLNVGLWGGVNEGIDGEMYDYDWLVPSISDWTDRSRSEVDVISAVMFDANLSLELVQGDGYTLSGVAGIMYDMWDDICRVCR